MARSLASSLGKVKSGCGCVGMHDKDCCNNPSYRKSGFSAANEDSIYTGGIPDLQTAEDSYTQEDRQNLNQLARHLYNNNGIAHGLVEMVVDHLGASYTPIPTPIKKLLPDWDDEDFQEWTESITCFHRDYLDGTKLLSASEDKNMTGLIQEQIRGTEIVGEVTATNEYLDPRQRGNKHRELGTAVNMFEPNRIYTPFNYQEPQTPRANRVVDGFKMDFYGRKLGAYIHNRSYEDCSFASAFDFGKAPPLTTMKYGGDLSHRQKLIHCFRPKHGLCRGVSAFAATAEPIMMQWQTLRNIALRAQRQNETTGVYASKNPSMTAEKIGPRIGLGGGHEMEGMEWDKDPHLSKFKDCSPAQKSIIWRMHHYKNSKAQDQGNTNGDIFLPDGDVYTQISHDNGTLAATELFDSLYHQISAGNSTGKSQLTKEYDGNYTAMRASRLDNDQSIMAKKNCTDDFANSIFVPSAEDAVEVGMLPLPKKVVQRWGLKTAESRHRYFVDNMRALTSMQWQKPHTKLIDPAKDAKGQKDLLAEQLTTKSKAVAALTGNTLVQHNEELLADKKVDIKLEIDCINARKEMYKAAGLEKELEKETETEDA